MRVFLTWMFRILIAAMAIAIVVPVVGSFLLAQQDFKSTINEWMLEATGREVSIDGDLGFTPGLELKIHAEGIRYENAEWASRESAFTADRVELEFSFIDLLQGKVVVQEAVITGGELWIEENATGSFNLVGPGKNPGRERAPIELPSWLELKRVNLFDSKIYYLHPRKRWDITLGDAALSSDDIDNSVVVKAGGMLQEVPISIEGTVGSVRTWFARTPSIVDLRAKVARTGSLSAQGSIDDVIGWRGIDVALYASIDQLRHLSDWFYSQPVDASSIVANARFFQPETVSSMQLRGIDANFWLWGVSTNLTGKVEKLSRLEQIDLKARANSPFRIDKIMPGQQFEHPVRARLDAGLVGESDDLTLDITHASLEMENLIVDAPAGTVGNITGNWRHAIPLNAKISDLAAFGKQFGRELPLVGEITMDANLWRGENGFSLEDIAISNLGAPISITGGGYLRRIGEKQQGKLNLTAQASSQFFRENRYTLPLDVVPDLLPEEYTAELEIHLDGGNRAADIKSLNFIGSGYVLRGVGEIPDLFEPHILDIGLEGSITNEEKFYSALGFSSPDIGPVLATANLMGKPEKAWDLRDIFIETKAGDSKLKALGSIENLGSDAQSAINFELESSAEKLINTIPGLIQLEPFAKELGTTRIAGALKSKSSSLWSMEDLDINTEWNGANVDLGGDIGQLNPLEGHLDVRIKGEFDSIPGAIAQYDLPRFSKVDAKFTVPLGKKNEFSGVDINLSERQTELKLNATLIQTAPLKTEWLRVTLNTEDIAALIPFDHSISPDTPLTSKIDFKIDPEKIEGSGSINVGNSDISGALEWAQGEDGRPIIKVISTAGLLDLKSLLLTEEKGGRLFSTKSLVPAWAQKFDGKFELEANTFRSSQFEVQNFLAAAQFVKGEMRIDFEGFSGDSRLEGLARIQPVGQSEISLKAKQIPMEALQSFSKGGIFQGGIFEADISLKGLGNSLAELLETGTGSIELDIYRSGIQYKALETVGADLLSNIVALVNPQSDRDDFISVECGVIHFDIVDGVATTRNGLALKTDRVTVLGGGAITFPDEAVKLVIAPKPRHGIGISATTIAKMIRVGGTLTQPEIESDPKGFFKSGAAIGAAIFSGGLSLVAQGLLDRVQANSEVCKIAQGLISLEPEGREDETKSR